MGLAIAFIALEGMFVLTALAAIGVIFLIFRRRPFVVFLLSACIVSVYFWSLFPTRTIHQRLCAGSSGERVFSPVRARNYFLVGEGSGDHGEVGAHTAMLDVVEGRADFVEIVKLPETRDNRLQGSVLKRYADAARIDWASAVAFRVDLRSLGSPECIWSPGASLQIPGRLSDHFPAGKCIAFTHAPKSTSRYGVQLYTAKPVWYAPEITERGISVRDTLQNQILGRFTTYSRMPRIMVMLVTGDEHHTCPPPYEIRTRTHMQHLHRKVLFDSR